ncbi:MAG: TSUP family transporter [Halarchaeum sp.]
MATRTREASFLDNLRDLRYRELLMTVATLAVFAGAVLLFPGSDAVTKGIQNDVTLPLFAFLLVVAVFAGAVKGAIGFGYALITTPIFASVVDPTMAVVVLAIPPWMINVFQVGETNTGLEYIRREWQLVALALVGSIVGVYALATFATGPLVPFVIGVVLLGYAAYQVATSFVVVEGAHHPVLLGAFGLLEGFFLAVANLGPLLPAYLHTFERDRERYIGGLSMVFTVVFTARIVQMAFFTDLLTTYRLWLGCALAVVTLVGLLAGTALRRVGFDETRFDWIVTAMLVVIGLNILRKTGPAVLTRIFG